MALAAPKDDPENRPVTYEEALARSEDPSLPEAKRDAYRRLVDEFQQAQEYFKAQREEGYREGLREGLILALHDLLADRGLVVSEEVRSRIEGCQDEALLRQWIRRAVTASSAEEVFAPLEPSS